MLLQLLLLILLATAAAAVDAVEFHDNNKSIGNNSTTTSLIYIVRHGEKTYGGGCLNIQGQERANNFPSMFNGKESELHARFEIPTAIFANNYFNSWGNCERCLLTVLPLSQSLNNLYIDFQHGFPDKFGGNKAAADAIRNKIIRTNTNTNNTTSNYTSVILVAWEHYNIQFLTAELGVNSSMIPYWDDEDYDTVYVIEVDSTTATEILSFDVRAQNYQPKSTTCDPTNYVPPPGWKPPKMTITTNVTTNDDNDNSVQLDVSIER